jgi:glycosyltransferase involved in cell wall biosynthesis
MPNYNHAHYLAEAITGIVNQSRPPDEFLLLDDCSTDHSLAVIEPFLQRFRGMRLLLHKRNQGVVASVEQLVREARGDYVLCAAADDIRMPGFFAQALTLAEQHPAAGLVFGKVRMIDEAGRDLGMGEATRWQSPRFADPQCFLREYLLVERPSQAMTTSTVFRRDALLEAGIYPQELGSWADAFVVRAIGLKYGVCYVPAEFTQTRTLAGSFSGHTAADPRRALNLIDRAEYLMKSPRYRDVFPADYVRQWRAAYRWQVIRDYFLGPEDPGQLRPSFLLRNVRRLPRVWRTFGLFFYRGDLSCFQTTAGSPANEDTQVDVAR